jgi:hypothetical protein
MVIRLACAAALVLVLGGCWDFSRLCLGAGCEDAAIAPEDASAVAGPDGPPPDEAMANRADAALAPPDLATAVDLAPTLDLTTVTTMDLTPPVDLAEMLDLTAPSPIQIVGSSSGVSTSATAIAAAVPTGVQGGDLILVQVWWDDPSHAINQPPFGFNLLATGMAAGQMVADWYWKIAAAGESGSYVVTFDGYVATAVFAVAYRGAVSAASATPADVVTGWPFALPAFSTTAPNQMAVAMIAYFQTSGLPISWTSPTDYSFADHALGAVVFQRAVAVPGPAGPDTTVASSNAFPFIEETVLLSSQ